MTCSEIRRTALKDAWRVAQGIASKYLGRPGASVALEVAHALLDLAWRPDALNAVKAERDTDLERAERLREALANARSALNGAEREILRPAEDDYRSERLRECREALEAIEASRQEIDRLSELWSGEAEMLVALETAVRAGANPADATLADANLVYLAWLVMLARNIAGAVGIDYCVGGYLKYGCEDFDLADWTDETVRRRSAQHEPAQAERYVEALTALVAYCRSVDALHPVARGEVTQ